MRHTSGHTGNRRSHHALAAVNSVKDKESGNLRLPHRLDEATGMYRGRQIYSPRPKKTHTHKAHGPDTEPARPKGIPSGQEAHANAEVKGSKGIFGRFLGARPKARSGFGGGV